MMTHFYANFPDLRTNRNRVWIKNLHFAKTTFCVRDQCDLFRIYIELYALKIIMYDVEVNNFRIRGNSSTNNLKPMFYLVVDSAHFNFGQLLKNSSHIVPKREKEKENDRDRD